MKTAVTMVSVARYFSEGKIDARGFIEFCAKLGVDAVDLLEYYWRDKAAEVPQVPGWLRDNGLTISAYAVGNNFVKTDAVEWREQIEYVKRGIETAAALGANKMRVFGGHIPENTLEREEGIKLVKEGLSSCLGKAAEYNVVLALENHGDMPGRSEEVLGIIREINSPFLRCNLDIANFMDDDVDVQEDPVGAVRKLLPYSVHSHVKDFAYFSDMPEKLKGCVLGEGLVPVRECLQIMSDGGYDGYLSLEFEGRAHIDELVGIEKSIKNLQAILKDLS